MDIDNSKKVIEVLKDIRDHFLRMESYSFYQRLMDLSKVLVELNYDKNIAHELLTTAHDEWEGIEEIRMSGYGPPHICTFLEYYDKLAEAKEDK